MAEGHRERVRNRIETNGITGLTDHELLEYLLFFVQPRINTNAVAHKLIDKYATLNGVFDADGDDLVQVEGIGSASAQFLTLLPELCRRYYLGRHRERERFVSLGRVVEYLDSLYLGVSEETAALTMLDAKKTLIATKILAKGSINQVMIYNRDLVAEVLKSKAVYVIFSHNHPCNNPQPSAEDIVLTNHLMMTLKVVGVELTDHVIICPNGSYYSFSKENAM